MSANGTIFDKYEGDIVECALKNDFSAVDTILEDDPSLINAQRSDTGLTALMAASGRGLRRMVVHILAKEGIDLFIRDFEGQDAFDYAVLFPEVTELLMRKRLPKMRWSEPFIKPI